MLMPQQSDSARVVKSSVSLKDDSFTFIDVVIGALMEACYSHRPSFIPYEPHTEHIMLDKTRSLFRVYNVIN